MTDPFPKQDKIMAMDSLLAEYFGNNVKLASAPDAPTPDDGEAEKVAQMELFTKVAAAEGIDLDKLSEEQIAFLWNETMNKVASSDGEPKESEVEATKESEGDPTEEKKEEAKKEHEQKKEASAKLAEATMLGKVMAHSMVAELREISKAAEAGAPADPGETPEPEESKEAAMPPALAKALGKGKEVAGKAVGAAKEVAGKAKDKAVAAGKSVKEDIKKHPGKAAGTAAVGAAGGLAGLAASKMIGKKKESSAIDQLAIVEAFKLASVEGFDSAEADERLAAVFTLGLGDSEKVASATNADHAVSLRALEFLEAAGYPVNWES